MFDFDYDNWKCNEPRDYRDDDAFDPDDIDGEDTDESITLHVQQERNSRRSDSRSLPVKPESESGKDL